METPGVLDMSCYQGANFDYTLTWQAGGSAVNLTGYSARMQVRDSYDADGAVYGCHQTKKDAIDQAVAVSLATDEPFEGERTLNIGDNNNMDIRATADELTPGVWIQWIQEDEIEYGRGLFRKKV